MCGIVGSVVVEGDVLADLVAGLRTLEYRGYDSAGIAVANGGELCVRRRGGRIDRLEECLATDPPPASRAGIGHTRWATHGPPSDLNAHPHGDGTGRLALVHNGIVENHGELKEELSGEGRRFTSETDTEVLAVLVGRELERGGSLADAVRRGLARVEGYYAIAVLRVLPDGTPELVAARHGPPLAVAVGDRAAWLASDVLALVPHSRDIVYLEDGDVAALRPGRIAIQRPDGTPVERPARRVDWTSEEAERGAFPHFMLKEIHDQPDVLSRTAAARLDLEAGDVRFEEAGWSDEELARIARVQVVACGTALHAGQVARYLIEGLAGIPVDVDFASEFRYRTPQLVPDTLALAVSQSGETADTLAALRLARDLGARAATICNVAGSTMVRESHASILTHAGPEIGVASTKAFVAQLVAAFLLALRLGRARGTIDRVRGQRLAHELRGLRAPMELLLAERQVALVRAIAERHAGAKGFLFLGRGINYPIALEGALKLKEISYVHAEGYPAGEMKHGPIALIEPGMSIVVVNSAGVVADKVRANVEQVRARGGSVICVGSDERSLALADERVPVPETSEWLSPVLNVVPLQLLAYWIAAVKGCDIDKPRNLAKSVTVE